jgi:hypothetical protein
MRRASTMPGTLAQNSAISATIDVTWARATEGFYRSVLHFSHSIGGGICCVVVGEYPARASR